MKVLVCGGRDFADYALGMRTLDAIHATTPITVIIHGDAPGADAMAKDWALSKGPSANICTRSFPADWDKYGKAAGPIRNQQMLEERPTMVVAFPGGRGTADMVRRAHKAGVPVTTVLTDLETCGDD